jgi:hypothetical protein
MVAGLRIARSRVIPYSIHAGRLFVFAHLAGRQFAFTGLQSVPGIEPASVSAEDGNRKVFESREPGILDKSPLEMSNPGILAK